MSQVQVVSLDFKAAILLLPVAPLERHGPHLPVGTDLFISSTLARQLGTKIEARWSNVTAVLGPLIPLGVQPVPGPGSVRTRQRPFHDTLFDFVQSLARSGFKHVALCSAHGSIGHFVALEEVAERSLSELKIRVESALSSVIVPFLGGRLLDAIEARMGRSLEEPERSALLKDCHGGQWETAAMLNIRPDLVHESYSDLEPVLMKGWLQLRDCMTESCQRGLGYVGAPADATVEYARAASEIILEKVLERVDLMLHSKRFRPSHTFFYYWPPYRTQASYDRRSLTRKLAATFTAGILLGATAASLLRKKAN